MHWVKDDKQNVVMVLLEFEKAYDRTEWPFVRGMLQAFGFPSYFCRWIDILFKDSSTVVEVNGELSEPIPLRRSIKQGCPIAPTLFVIVVDALYYIMRAPKLGPSIIGLTLPNTDDLINDQFADDFALFLALNEENFDNSMDRL
ncbi:secreted RxLR effector protein 78-like [Cryptomeria japonica]|uniref:secreted RxLR effector protein 78-like n=1 Tax=Cryptomeria japonica TaxID=3369 RepID=UPI0027DA4619|nr:secreted RxLR effector protein 78-like [Cryptomeria japonica]